MSTAVPRDFDALVLDRVGEGRFSVHRDVMRDPEIFELEMRYIFEHTWIFLGLASQAPNPHDYFTSWIGRHPVMLSRAADGTLHALLNTCRHRGARVCQHAQGNSKYHVCPYHGWAYDSAGRNVYIKDRKQGCYSAAFDAEDHSLMRVPRFEEYRGMLFGCLDPEVHSLDEHLGEARVFLDLVIDQGEHGVELVPGCSTYTYKANWKLQMENGLDGYHLTSTHPSFMRIVERRKSGESKNRLSALDISLFKSRGGFTFDHGHAAVWSQNPAPEVRPLYSSLPELRARVGDLRAEWMFNTRNLCLFPNVQFADNASLQLRTMRPLAVNLTEMKSWCLAPVGESAQARELRLRQFEDFFNPSGLATPDDTSCYEDCQTGNGARIVEWQLGYSRGMTSVRSGADEVSDSLGFRPATSQRGEYEIQDETVFHSAYREWLRLMKSGAARAAKRSGEEA